MDLDTRERPLFSVVTPTFNRAHTLPRVYESLSEQTLRDFEWLVIDDGSIDETRELVSAWIETAPFSIRYHFQQNAGKAAAENKAAELARGDLLAVLDSDDWYVPSALEIFANAWSSIEPGLRLEYAGIVALCADPAGSVIGDPLPQDILDTDYTELRSRYRITGDKCGCMRIDVVRRFPYPTFAGEGKGGFESIVLRRIAREFRCRCTNEVAQVKEYQVDGVTARGVALWIASPRSAKLSMLESLRDSDLTRAQRLENYAHHMRFSLHAGVIHESWKDSPSKLLWLCTTPVGIAFYVRDRLRGWDKGARRHS